MGKIEKMFEKMLKSTGKSQTLGEIAIKQLEERKKQGLLSKAKADILIKDIKKQLKECEKDE